MLTEQECIEVAAKVWGFTGHRGQWLVSKEGEIIAFDNGLEDYTNSPDGAFRTLEAMRAKGWYWQIHTTDRRPMTWLLGMWRKEPRRWVSADAEDLTTAIHRAALAALRAQG